MTSIRISVSSEERAQYAEGPYFAVGTTKFVVLSVCSLGLYDVFWCYQQWERERRLTGESLSPFWRAFFAPIWMFSLLERIHARSMSHRVPAQWSANALAIGYLILTVSWRLPDPYGLLSLFTFAPLLPVRSSIDRLNVEAAPDAKANHLFSGLNVTLIVFGVLVLSLAVLGAFLSEA
jgi:hypothetical protein